jgi:membrane protease YdiL (CAAX protease family)
MQSTSRTTETSGPSATRVPASADLVAVIAAMIFPSVGTWLYFVALDGNESMKLAYAGTKIVQFAFPALWLLWIRRGRPSSETPNRARGIGAGIVFGLVIGAAMMFAYLALVNYTSWLDPGVAQVRAKVLGMGLDTPAKFAGLALFYSLIHSFLEEYYWRWYVFGELRRFVRDPAAIALSSLGFMAHHVIVLNLYFREAWWLTLLLSASVAIGGAFWAWLYRRTGTLVAPWLSHALVDAGIMAVGYQMIWGLAA